MQKFIKIISYLSFVVLFSSCAAGYRKINPVSLNYISKSTEGSVVLEYKYDLLKGKYKKKEAAKGLKIVAVKITNNSENDLIFGKDIKLAYENDALLNIVDYNLMHSQIKQNVPVYLIYGLLTLLTVTITKSDPYNREGSVDVYHPGYVLGPGLVLGNMIVASSANTNLKKDLMDYDMTNKVIKKGETLHGLININSYNFDAIKIKSFISN
jgi:hypothetical protein